MSMKHRPPVDDREWLLLLGEFMADPSDLSEDELAAELRELGLAPEEVTSTGVAEIQRTLDAQRLSWRVAARTRRERSASHQQRRRGEPRPRPELLRLLQQKQAAGARAHWHKLKSLEAADLEDLLADLQGAMLVAWPERAALEQLEPLHRIGCCCSCAGAVNLVAWGYLAVAELHVDGLGDDCDGSGRLPQSPGER